MQTSRVWAGWWCVYVQILNYDINYQVITYFRKELHMTVISKKEFSALAALFGRDYLAYILNFDLKLIPILEKGGGDLSDTQTEVIQLLKPIVEQLKFSNPRPNQLGIGGAHYFHNLKTPDNEYLSSVLRKIAVPEKKELKQTDDPVLESLSELCRVAYPYLLIPIDGFSHFNREAPSLHGMPKMRVFLDAVINDPVLIKLFNIVGDDPHGINTSGSIYTSLDSGGGIQLATFHRIIFHNSWVQMKLQSKQSLEDFIEIACSQIIAARKAIKGELVFTPTFAFFDGTGIEEGHKIELKDGVLYPISKDMLPYMPHDTIPSNFTNGLAGMMLETTTEFKINIEPVRSSSKSGKRMSLREISTTSSMYEKANRVELGTILATSDTHPVKARHVGEVIINPLHFPRISSKFKSRSISKSLIIDKKHYKAITEWVDLIGNKDISKVKMATRRYLSAINERLIPEDSLVDAVIGLENLFGIRSEIAFAISNSVARLLGSSFGEREKIFKKMKRIYSARSDIIHSNREIKYEIVEDYRISAIYYLSCCLKVLLKEKNNLLSMNAIDRVKLIALEDT
ncbi:MAG: hypothetical protein HRU29_09490 [Rhizobiales bacterium]|nr:HEPN domain-containing protein [Hyphomicrobiales bacterium]NRB14622.1 hypothetical protein [Hyphomicrobiales bacterium]